jgi:hypothetical protein
MRTLTVEASNLQSARGLYDALAAYGAELVEDGVKVVLADSREIAAVLSAIQRHVLEDGWSRTARIDLDGRCYVLHGN